MPVITDPDLGGGHRMLLDGAGREVGRYEQTESAGHAYADVFTRPPAVSAADAAAVVLAELRGLRIAGDEELGRELVAAGGRPLRHVHLLSRDLGRDPPRATVPPGLRLTPVDRPAADLLEAYRLAYAPGHLDHRDEPPEKSLQDLDGYVSGREFGPLLPGSGLAVAAGGTVAAALLLGTLPGDPPDNGPWVIELFRHPAHRGAGRALLERGLALATEAGVPVLGLMVTEGNPARRLYEQLGFERVRTLLVVELLGTAAARQV